jgi:SAM-dependent methyltransferase
VNTVANGDQIEYWNEVSGPKWVRLQEELDEQLQPLEEALLANINLDEGDSVLDVGCGCGATSLTMGKIVREHGHVTGVDVSLAMLQHAKTRTYNHSNVQFIEGDAQVYKFPNGPFDHIVSRFGVMFFENPTEAFRNLLKYLKPEGTLSFICWRALEDNPWMKIPVDAATQHVPRPPEGEPHAPGPAAFADAERTKKILHDAGFHSITISPLDMELPIGPDGTVDASVDFTMKMGPVPRMLNDADEATVELVREAIKDALKYYDGEQGVRLRSATWIVQAKGIE